MGWHKEGSGGGQTGPENPFVLPSSGGLFLSFEGSQEFLQAPSAPGLTTAVSREESGHLNNDQHNFEGLKVSFCRARQFSWDLGVSLQASLAQDRPPHTRAQL